MNLKKILSILPGANEIEIFRNIQEMKELEQIPIRNKKDFRYISSKHNSKYLENTGRIILTAVYLGYGIISYNQNSLNPKNWKSDNSEKKYNIENIIKK